MQRFSQKAEKNKGRKKNTWAEEISGKKGEHQGQRGKSGGNGEYQ